MSAPFIIVTASVVTALLAGLGRNYRTTSALISASGAALIGVFVLFAPFDSAFDVLGIPIRFDSSWIILGRALNMPTAIRPMIGFLYLIGLYMFSGSWVLEINRFFPSIAMLVLLTVAASIMVEPFLYAAAFIGLAAMGSVLLLVSPLQPRSVGAVRIMVLYTFSVLTILLSGWMIETGSGTGSAYGEGVRVAIVLTFGFTILMAIPPFHIWLTAAAEDANPYILAFVTVLLQGAGFFLLLRFLDAFAWLREDPIFSLGLEVVSAGTVILASLWALSTPDLRKVFAYAVIADMGAILLALSHGSPEGSRIALALFGTRIFGIAVLALGLSLLMERATQWRGAGREQPVAALSILIGLLSLTGFPLTAGFPARWALTALEFQSRALILFTLLATLMIFALLVMRWAIVLFEPTDASTRQPRKVSQQIYMIIGISSLVVLGIAPQVVIPWVVEVASGLTNLFP